MRLVIWRDSVCAGDDVDAPHELSLTFPSDASLQNLADLLLAQRYLASISGGQATWILESTRPLAVFAQQWPHPRFLMAPDTPLTSLVDPEALPHLQFRYQCQADPEQVFNCLTKGLPLPTR